MKAILLVLLVSLTLSFGIFLDAWKVRTRQKVSVTRSFLLSVANYVGVWTATNRRLPNKLEDTNDGLPWKDACENPISYKIIDADSFIFSVESDCGGLSQNFIFKINGTNLVRM
jgi:hypothetical protein